MKKQAFLTIFLAAALAGCATQTVQSPAYVGPTYTAASSNPFINSSREAVDTLMNGFDPGSLGKAPVLVATVVNINDLKNSAPLGRTLGEMYASQLANKGLNVTEMKLRGEPVFAVPLPPSILRLQRREVFRLQLPSAKPYVCRIRRGSPEEIALPLHDISVGGIGIFTPQALNYEPLEKLENCWIDLHDNGMLAMTLEVRYVTPMESRTGKPLWHLGCRFVDLSAANETQIQRFMARIEAERRALSGG